MHILVIEDDPIIAEGIAACIELIGHEVAKITYNGQDAVRSARELNPDLLIADIKLPDFSGFEVVRNLDNAIPCVFLTAYSDKKLVEEACGINGTYGYLIKPVNECELKAAIDIAVARYNEKTELQKSLEASQKSLEDRKLIERAKGILMDNLGLKEHEAMAFLQKKSKDNNKKLREIAQSTIDFFGK